MAYFLKKILLATTNSRHQYLDWLTITLVILWIFFLLFIGRQIQPAEQLTLIQAYSKNLGILVVDKVACFFQLSAYGLIQQIN